MQAERHTDVTHKETCPGTSSPARKLLHRLPALVGLVLLVAAFFVIQREVRHLALSDIRHALHAMPVSALVAGAACTVLSYFILSFYDYLACVHVRAHQRYRRAAFAAFCSYVLSHNLGCAAISGAAVRFRLYRNWGVPPGAIAQIIAFCSTTYLLGASALIGGVLVFEPGQIPLMDRLPTVLVQLCGLAAWGLDVAYLVASLRLREVRVWGYAVEVPSFGIALAQILISAGDMAATALIAYVMLPASTPIGFGAFLAIYLAAYTAGLLASVPGGLGVFDSAMLLALRPYMPAPDILGVIFVFRLFYYFVPLVMAGVMFAGHELFLRGDAALARKRGLSAGGPEPRRVSQAIRESEADFSVSVATGVTACTGVLLVFYAVAAPVPHDAFLGHWLPQFADLLLCFAGVVFVGLSFGLSQRVTLAWRATLIMLIVSLLLSLLRQAALAVPLSLLLVIFLIAPFRACYYRRAHLLAEPGHRGTILWMGLWLSSVALFGIFLLNRRLGQGWWHALIYEAHTSVIRWALAISAVFGLIAVAQMTRRGRVRIRAWNEESASVYRTLDHALEEFGPRRPNGLLLDETGKAAIPFMRTGRFIIGLGDPAGPERESIAAIWRLRDLALQEGRRLAFIKIGDALESVYNDIGMTVCQGDAPMIGTLCCGAQDIKAIKTLLASDRRRLLRHSPRPASDRSAAVRLNGGAES